MKTTVELPDALMKRVKIRAAENNQKLKDTLAEIIEIGLLPNRTVTRVKAKLRGGFIPSTTEIEAAIAAGRD